MMISEGNGIQADSIAIKSTMPEYPKVEITATINVDKIPMIFAIKEYLVSQF